LACFGHKTAGCIGCYMPGDQCQQEIDEIGKMIGESEKKFRI